VNIHLTRKKKRREFIGVIEHWLKIDICGVVETWFKDNGRALEEELKNSDFQWFGKDRKHRHCGGIGFLVRKNLQTKVINSSSENIMWISVHPNIYVAVVYLIPIDKTGVNKETLHELQQDILRLKEIGGKVVVLGDFNCRIGSRSNFLGGDSSDDTKMLEVARSSEDRVISSQGQNLLDRLNAVGMIVVNGIREKARFTFQGKGRSVIDLFWVDYKDMHQVLEVKVWNREMEIMDKMDHRIVTIDWQGTGQSMHDPQQPHQLHRSQQSHCPCSQDAEQRPLGWRKRASEEAWTLFRELLDQARRNEEEEKEIDQKSQSASDRAWQHWLRIVTKAADGSIGRQEKRPNRKENRKWDGRLAQMVAEQNRSRKNRDVAEGESRKQAHVEYQRKRRIVKKYLKQKERLLRRTQNEEMEKLKRSDARKYWMKIKTFLGLGKEEQQLPQELKLGDGGAAKKAWRDAFQKLGKVNEKDPDFDEQFLQECQQQIDGWMQELNKDRGELDKDIERAEVVKAVKAMKAGKASGVALSPNF
jgi:hypothetical protein